MRAGILLSIVLVSCGCAWALDPSLDVSQYAHTAWKVRDGFTKGIISTVAQTPDGYLWLGTEFGLVRFDGVRTVPWKPPSSKQLPSNDVTSLVAARDGTLWIGTRNGLARWDGEVLTIYPQLAGQWTRALIQDREGTIWAGGSGLRSSSMLCAIRGTNVQCWGGNGMFAPGISCIYEDLEGRLWVGVSSRGLYRWKPGPQAYFSFPEKLTEVRGFAETDSGVLLISGTPAAPVRRFADGRFEDYQLQGISKPIVVNAGLRDRDGGLWIATADRGLAHVHQGKVDTFTQADGLSGDVLTNLFEDREGDIWVVGPNGLDRFRAFAIPRVSSMQGLSNGFAWSVLAANDGSVWISTSKGLSRWEHGRVSVFGRRNGRTEPDGKLNGGIPHSLFQDSSGRIWAATLKEIGYLENDRFIPLEGVGGGGVISGIAEQPFGHIWLANQWAGLRHLFRGKLLDQIPWAALGHPRDYAQTLIADPVQGGLWLGFINGGVVHFDDGKVVVSYSTANGLGHAKVNDLRLDSGGVLWAATEGGLSRIHDGYIATLNSKNGLPCDAVQWSIEDEDHSVWLLLSCGLARLARSDLDAWVADSSRSVKPVLFDFSDGVLSHSTTASETPRVSKSGDGKIWFTTGDGVSIIDPRHLNFNNLAPPVHIEQITTDERKYNAVAGLHLPPHTHYLTIDYTALSLTVPERVRFRYRLEGVDPDWREVQNERQVQYSNLAPGNYRFRVIACNNSGVWNEEGASLDFSIAPANYQTNWFRALCVAAFISMLWAIYQLRVRAFERRQAVLVKHQSEIRALNEQMIETQEAERIRIAGDLHDGVLQQITSLTLKLAKMRRQVPPNSEAIETVNGLQQQLIQIGTDIRHLSHELHPALLQDAGLPVTLCVYCEEFSKVRDVSVVCEADSTVKELSPGIALCLYRIAQEALGNAAKHSAAKKVEVRLTQSDGFVCLSVSDDGVGCDTRQIGKSGGLGVISMRERVVPLGGTFEFDSEPGRGTTVRVTVPFRLAS